MTSVYGVTVTLPLKENDLTPQTKWTVKVPKKVWVNEQGRCVVNKSISFDTFLKENYFVGPKPPITNCPGFVVYRSYEDYQAGLPHVNQDCYLEDAKVIAEQLD